MMFTRRPVALLVRRIFCSVLMGSVILEVILGGCGITICQAFQPPASLVSSRPLILSKTQQSRYPTKVLAVVDKDNDHPQQQQQQQQQPQTIDLQFAPSQIILDQVSLQYPVTLARKLFSSVPHRDYAVDHVSCQFCAEAVLLQGASSSGKSALMEIILRANRHHPKKSTPKYSGIFSGRVVVDSRANINHREDASSEVGPNEQDSVIIKSAVPILLAEKPPYDNTQTVQALLEQEARHCISCCLEPSDEDVPALVAAIVAAFGRLAHLDNEELRCSKTPAQLSPSENFRLRLVEAYLQSSVPHITTSSSTPATTTYTLPAPIILLDEWLDFETLSISSKVEEAVLKLVQETGAVVICATHKPNLWKNLMATTPHTTQMTMCRGSILTLQQHQQENT